MLIGCASSSPPEKRLIGNWQGVQASSAIGTTNPIRAYNYWEVRGDNRIVFKMNTHANEDGHQGVALGEQQMDGAYSWVNKRAVKINDTVYQVKWIDDRLILQGEQDEFTFIRSQ
ncbi:hypothetical protein [Cohnella nanjingensis]|nr:hypothetical protein [Cohnella nanjingensis]